MEERVQLAAHTRAGCCCPQMGRVTQSRAISCARITKKRRRSAWHSGVRTSAWEALATARSRRCVPRGSVISTDRCVFKGASCRRERVGGRDLLSLGAIRVWTCIQPQQRRTGSIGPSRRRSGLSGRSLRWRLWWVEDASLPENTDATLSQAHTQLASRTCTTLHRTMRRRSLLYRCCSRRGARRDACQISPGASTSCRRMAHSASNHAHNLSLSCKSRVSLPD